MSKKITEEEFLARFHSTNPQNETIIFLSQFICVSKKITCQCTVCGHIWEVRAADLYSLNGHKIPSGCPHCNCSGGHNKLTHEEFVDRVNSTNRYAKYIQITSQYQGNAYYIFTILKCFSVNSGNRIRNNYFNKRCTLCK